MLSLPLRPALGKPGLAEAFGDTADRLQLDQALWGPRSSCNREGLQMA